MAESTGEPALFVVGDEQPAGRRRGRPRAGRHEAQLNASIRQHGLGGAVHAAAVAGARAVARGLDVAEAGESNKDGRPDPYATAQLARVYRELLLDLGLVTRREVSEDDELDGFGDATVGHAEDAGPA